MGIKKSIKDLGVSVNGVEPKGNTVVEILKSFGFDFTGTDVAGNTIADVIENTAKNYEFGFKVSAVTGNTDLFGKVASNLQEDIELSSAGITGTLHYIEDYSSAFGGDEASGNYIALKAECDGAVITAEVVGGVHGPVTLDEDGIVVCRIANNNQSIRFVATKENESVSATYALTDLVLEADEN